MKLFWKTSGTLSELENHPSKSTNDTSLFKKVKFFLFLIRSNVYGQQLCDPKVVFLNVNPSMQTAFKPILLCFSPNCSWFLYNKTILGRQNYFRFLVLNQDKNCIPHMTCNNCRLVLSSA